MASQVTSACGQTAMPRANGEMQMKIGIRKTPSRENQKQVIAFLQTNQASAAYDKAAADDKTNQEVIGEAINAVFSFYGRIPPVQPGHQRIARRKLRARLRIDGKGPSCRANRVSYGGWFDLATVGLLQALTSELNISVQDVIEHGLFLITGVASTSSDNDDSSDLMDSLESPPVPEEI